MKIISTIIFLCLFALPLFAQSESVFPAIIEGDIPGGRITRGSYYSGDALWGLIDGGADLYLEYGFDKLLLQEIEWHKIKFRIEFYKMNDAKSAYGIYSVSQYKCDKNDTLTKFICITPYQIQSALGKIYVSIANDKGNNEALNFSLQLFNNIISRTTETLFDVPDYFKKDSFKPYVNNFKFIKGKLGLQNGFPAWSDLFDQFQNFEIFALPLEKEKGYIYTSQIKFESENDLKRFKEIIEKQHAEKYMKIIPLISKNEIIFVETN
jgi:hypothetical protein